LVRYDAARLAALDAQIAQAKRDGLSVILTLYTDPNYDDGLNETFEAGGGKRPAYTTWKSLPSVQ
jgi:hypothetical protein